MLAGNSRNSLYSRNNTEFLTVSTHAEVFLLHVSCSILQHKSGNLEVAEAHNLCLSHYISGNFLNTVVFAQFCLIIHYVLQSLKEPGINFCKFYNTVNSITLFQRLGDGKDTQVCGVGQFVIKILELGMIITNKTMHTLSNHAQTLLDKFFKSASD